MTPAALAELVRSVALDVLSGHGLDCAALPATVMVARPRNRAHGDYATSVALQTGKRAGVAPRQFAGWLADELARRPGVRCAEVAGPGFLNLWLGAQAHGEILAQVLAAGERFGVAPGNIRWSQRTRDNPMSCAQYAHARLVSLARNAADLGISMENAQLELLDQEREGELIRTLGEFPRIVALAAQRDEPDRVARYVKELADVSYRLFDRVLPRGDEPPRPQHDARLALCEATRQVLANGLRLLGASAPERM